MINKNNFKVMPPNESKFMIKKDYEKSLRSNNYSSKPLSNHPRPQEFRRVRSDIRLSVLGKPLEGNTSRYTGIKKDSGHYIRVYSQDKTPWISYDLKPQFKVRQDPFCTRYSEFLKYELAQRERHQKNSRMLKFYHRSIERIDSDPLFFMDNLSKPTKHIDYPYNSYEYEEVFLTHKPET